MSMYLEHYGLAEAPFRITPHTDFFFAGANRGATLEALIYAITHDEGIVKVSGEVGTGKTMLCRVLMERLPENVVIVYLANPALSRTDILYALTDELGIDIPEKSRAKTVMRALQEKLVALYAAGKQVVALIDEAHAMPTETLEEIRLLSNLESNRHKLLQLVLFGQPEINEILGRADMRQLRDRITHNFSLEPLVRDDIAQYLDFRMRAAGYRGPSVFAPTAIKRIAQASQGLTRRINILADKSLLAAFSAGGHQVGAREAKAAIGDSEFAAPYTAESPRLPRPLLWASGGALAVLLGLGLAHWLAPPAAPALPQTALPAANKEHSSPDKTPLPLPPTAPEKSPTAPSYPLLDQWLEKSRPWIDAVDKKRWFLQLHTINDTHPEQVETFLQQLRDTGVEMEQIRVYHSNLSGTSRYGVIYGEFMSRNASIRAAEALPPDVKTLKPYPRQAARLK